MFDRFDSTLKARARQLVAGVFVTGLASFGAADAKAQAGTEEQPLRVLFASAVNNLPMMVAAENGYWRQLGLVVEARVLDSGSQIARALMAGEADIAAGNATSSIPLSRAAGSLLTLVGPYHNNPYVVSGVERVGVIAARGAGVSAENPEALAGMTIGVSLGSTGESYLRGYLASIGLSAEDVTLVNLAVPDMSVALRQGTVDAIVPWEPYVSEVIRTHGDEAEVVARGGPFGSSVVGIMVLDDYLDTHRDVLERYVLGAWMGVQFTRQNPEQAVRLAQRYIQGLNPEDGAAAISFMRAEFDPRISPCTEAAVMRDQEALIAGGRMNVAEPFDYAAIVQVDFINGLLAAHPELVADLDPLPASIDACEGQ